MLAVPAHSLAPPTVGRALQVAEKGECSHGDAAFWLAATRAPAPVGWNIEICIKENAARDAAFWLAATRAGALEPTRSQGLAQPNVAAGPTLPARQTCASLTVGAPHYAGWGTCGGAAPDSDSIVTAKENSRYSGIEPSACQPACAGRPKQPGIGSASFIWASAALAFSRVSTTISSITSNTSGISAPAAAGSARIATPAERLRSPRGSAASRMGYFGSIGAGVNTRTPHNTTVSSLRTRR